MEISIQNLTKSFGEQVVLNNLNLELADIHSLAIIGPSGGGKSTLLRILAGLEIPQEGKITINSEPLNFDYKSLQSYRKGIGVVFQAFNLFPHLTALQNITLPLEKVHGLSLKEAGARASELLDRFQLGEHMHKRPHQLSGGQQQRVAIVRAIALQAKFMLLDEPTSALDPILTSEVLDSIKELKEEKKDLILVTHEMGFARNVADHLIFVDKGTIIEQGHPKELFENPQSEELKSFLGKTLKY
ncbi:amino acid ABC transporter ATP-binding protein [Propionigenium maris DSM 9537]|uniref:Amino acid ABC transporter ATP-binding protein n=1 Tax=Propionigenium maris DSM 9537 TaxID=1123000 RepID=A0A9W6GN61_9FUSO|nr:amino acid ABC transporter ATP-binding protein [Propionigenium maris]GLI57427.1 amino acid ABC transporter ATP-binding protein [Propionigenium maris DSM 9537]